MLVEREDGPPLLTVRGEWIEGAGASRHDVISAQRLTCHALRSILNGVLYLFRFLDARIHPNCVLPALLRSLPVSFLE